MEDLLRSPETLFLKILKGIWNKILPRFVSVCADDQGTSLYATVLTASELF
jgi:hypothetical protein